MGNGKIICQKIYVPAIGQISAQQPATSNKLKGIKMITWNKGPAALHTKMDEIKTIIEARRPLIFAIHEANLQPNIDKKLVNISGFRLYTDPLGGRGLNNRTVVYVHESLSVRQREDLQDNELALVSLSVGRFNQKRFNVIAFYRQWRTNVGEKIERDLSNQINQQEKRFIKIINIWKKSIGEGRETFTLSDTNLPSPLLLEDQDPSIQVDVDLRGCPAHPPSLRGDCTAADCGQQLDDLSSANQPLGGNQPANQPSDGPAIQNDQCITCTSIHDWPARVQEAADQPARPRYNPLMRLARHFSTEIRPLGVTILNNKPTHVHANGTPVIIDHITTTEPGKTVNTGVHFDGTSDHAYIETTRLTKNQVTFPRYRIIRNFKEINKMEAEESLRQSSQIRSSILQEDPDAAASLLIGGITEVLDQLAPKRRIQIRKNLLPYMSRETKELRMRRDEALKISHSTNSQEDKRSYRILRNRVTQSIRNDKFNFASETLKDKDPQKRWAEVKRLTGVVKTGPPTLLNIGGEVVTSPKRIAEGMNKFYIDKVTKLRKEMPQSALDPAEGLSKLMAGRGLDGKFSFQPVSRRELNIIIRNMRPTKSAGVDGLSMRIIKDYYQVLAPAIHHLVNIIITTKIFPTSLKVAKVLPLLKTGKDSSQCGSYRPINLLPALSKVAERTMFYQFLAYLNQENIIPHNHHGSRGKHSTLTALLTIYEKILTRWERGETVAIMAADQTASYDLIDHPILLRKLAILGMDESSKSLMSSYLSDRQQTVEIESFTSTVRYHPPCSVIQGSVGSCLMYLCYTLDLPVSLHLHKSDKDKDEDDNEDEDEDDEETPAHTCIEEDECAEGNVVTYVDDSQTITSHKDPIILEGSSQKAIDNLSEYFNANKLVNNRDKAQWMLITSKRNCPQIAIEADTKLIYPTAYVEVLGAIIQQDLKLQRYAARLISQLHMRLTALRALQGVASRNLILQVANGIIMGKISYILPTLRQITQLQKQKLQSIMLQAAKLVIGRKSFRWSTRRILTEVKWMSIQQLIEYHSQVQIHKIVSNKQPSYLYEKRLKPMEGRTRLQAAGNIQLPNWKTDKARGSIFYEGVDFYNNLSNETKTANSMKIFKSRLRDEIKYKISYYLTARPAGRGRVADELRQDDGEDCAGDGRGDDE